ncbi:MAG: TrpR like protein, YerC/YecD [Sphingomonas sp.]|uniref:YerC/YecD family TrpR-related protein n=1 Tax=Sphingomonas sp. TaxID=28214 RepID=UPI0018574299|nr:YerC/YecD family TrpR-related protein [Sphingomonas sp.]MBA3668001.1 TrpR like protein, YerC/YecD [Sphingomonas sp.]
MSPKQTLSDARAALADELAEALVQLKEKGDARALLADLCTPAEIHSLAERWHVAKLLDVGELTYREIHEATGVSTTTIVRVARFLRQENNGGYRLLLDRVTARR